MEIEVEKIIGDLTSLVRRVKIPPTKGKASIIGNLKCYPSQNSNRPSLEIRGTIKVLSCEGDKVKVEVNNDGGKIVIMGKII